jgi:hypothetical protein
MKERKMKIGFALLPGIALLFSSATFAESPFDGTWSLNTSKSQLAGDTFSYADAGNGMLKFTDSDQTYTFKPDGSSFSTPMGAERTVLKTGDDSYTATSKKGALLLRTTTIKVSSDGKTLTEESKGTKPNGDTFDDTSTYVRTSPGTGLIGGWKSTKVKLSSPNSLTIQTDAANGVTLILSAVKATCQAKWDGKDSPATGPTVSDGITLALSKTGTSGFKLVEKSKDKVIMIAHYRVSPDGKTMTTKGTNGQGTEPFTQVWDKQS